MLTGKQLKMASLGILDTLLPEIQLNHFQSGNAERDRVWFRSAEGTVQQLKDRIQAPPPPNPAYADMAELAAELVYSGYHYPETVAMMFLEICDRADDIDIRTAYGLGQVSNLYAMVCDDHDYVLDPESRHPLLRRQGELGRFVRLVGVSELLEAIRSQRALQEEFESMPVKRIF